MTTHAGDLPDEQRWFRLSMNTTPQLVYANFSMGRF